MKHFFIKIASVLIALLVLFSTFSFTVEKHFCGDFLMDVSFTGNLEVCATDIAPDSSVKLKKCCKDEIQKIDGQDELQQNSINKISFQQKQFLVAFFVSYTNLFSENKTNTNFYKDFSPPDIPLDYQVFYQTFLI
jgi:hypothetical protein